MIRFLEAPRLPALNTRGSSHVGVSGLFVLGLGSLVLLAGLAKPDPTENDVVVLTRVTLGSTPALLQQWLAGLAMTGWMLVMMGLGGRARKLLRLLTART